MLQGICYSMFEEVNCYNNSLYSYKLGAIFYDKFNIPGPCSSSGLVNDPGFP